MTKQTAKSTESKMAIAREIVRAAYENTPEGMKPRQAAIAQMMASEKKGGLGMEKTTAATYHAHCITYFREREQEEALKKAEAGKPVWTAFKANKQGKVTSVGIFLTKKAATEFNSAFKHSGVEKGVLEVGAVVKAA